MAEPNHQLVRSFETTVGEENISLPIGSVVEVAPGDGKMAAVRHTLPGGSTTLLFIPMEYLKVLPVPARTRSSAKPSGSLSPGRAVQTEPTPARPTGIRLTTTDGQSVDGNILRLEKRYVVMLDEAGEPQDLLLKDLDSSSQDLVDRWKFQQKNRAPQPDPRVVPGKKFSLEFPDLGASRTSEIAKIQIRIPENYQPDKPSPLALYFGGGEGTDNCDPLSNFVDAKDWVLVAFPYPKNVPTPLHAYDEGKCGELIEFQEPMLERLQALLPNTDPNRRVVVGTSNGAHMIAIGACDGWKDFPEYFSAFVMHEGGGSEGNNFRSLRKKDVFVLMGDQSKSLKFSRWVVANVERARVKPDVFIAIGEGHGMGDASRSAIKDWIAKLPENKTR